MGKVGDYLKEMQYLARDETGKRLLQCLYASMAVLGVTLLEFVCVIVLMAKIHGFSFLFILSLVWFGAAAGLHIVPKRNFDHISTFLLGFVGYALIYYIIAFIYMCIGPYDGARGTFGFIVFLWFVRLFASGVTIAFGLLARKLDKQGATQVIEDINYYTAPASATDSNLAPEDSPAQAHNTNPFEDDDSYIPPGEAQTSLDSSIF